MERFIASSLLAKLLLMLELYFPVLIGSSLHVFMVNKAKKLTWLDRVILFMSSLGVGYLGSLVAKMYMDLQGIEQKASVITFAWALGGIVGYRGLMKLGSWSEAILKKRGLM